MKVEQLLTEYIPLVSQLAYVIARLHRDMYVQSNKPDVQLGHYVVLDNEEVCSVFWGPWWLSIFRLYNLNSVSRQRWQETWLLNMGQKSTG